MRYLILLIGLAFWTGCKGGVDKTLVQVAEETHPLNPAGILHVKNVEGTIRLYGWDRPEVQIKITKKAYTRRQLQAIGMQVSSLPDSLSIDTIFPPAKKWSLRDRSGVVEYEIVMPQYLSKIGLVLTNGEISIDGLRGGSANAELVNGRISARNCFAKLEYQVKNGAIDFYHDWWENAIFDARATTPNGGIGVFLPGNASFRVNAETEGGTILSNLIDDQERERDHIRKLTRKFGGSEGPAFTLRATNGNIRIDGY